jgi:GMP synthase (glutamine-hydrolysing)
MHVLGICYGMQLLVQKLGGEVAVGDEQEYGKMEIEVKESALHGADEVGGHLCLDDSWR